VPHRLDPDVFSALEDLLAHAHEVRSGTLG
jgi:hypothetical protein